MDLTCDSIFTLVRVTCQTFWKSLVWSSSSKLREITTFSTRFCPTRSLKSWVSTWLWVTCVSVVFSHHRKKKWKKQQKQNKTWSLALYCSGVHLSNLVSPCLHVLQRCCWSQIIPMTTPSSLRGKPKWLPLMMQKNWWQQMSVSYLFHFLQCYMKPSSKWKQTSVKTSQGSCVGGGVFFLIHSWDNEKRSRKSNWSYRLMSLKSYQTPKHCATVVEQSSKQLCASLKQMRLALTWLSLTLHQRTFAYPVVQLCLDGNLKTLCYVNVSVALIIQWHNDAMPYILHYITLLYTTLAHK